MTLLVLGLGLQWKVSPLHHVHRAYNLCYTTLLHPDDVASGQVPPDQVFTTPTGALRSAPPPVPCNIARRAPC